MTSPIRNDLDPKQTKFLMQSLADMTRRQIMARERILAMVGYALLALIIAAALWFIES